MATALEVGYRSIDTAAALRQRGRRRPGHRRAPASRARSSSSPPRSGTTTRATTPRSRAFDASAEAARPRRPRPLPHPLAGAGARTATSTRGRRCSSCATRAASAPSVSATSSRRTCSGCSTRPASCRRINQIELHPYLQQQRAARVPRRSNGIVTEAWSPLASGGDVLDDPAIAGIARDARRAPRPRSILRWHLQLGNVVIPKSVTPEPDRRELRRLRLRARRRRPRRDRGPRPRRAHRPRPRRPSTVDA